MKILKRPHGFIIELGDVSIIVDGAKRYRNQLHKRGIWVTKDLQEIPVAEMEDRPLLYAIRFVEARAMDRARRIAATSQASSTACYPEPNGEMAQDADWQEVAWEEERKLSELGVRAVALTLLLQEPIFKHLVHQCMERGLHPTICGQALPDKS